MANFYTDNPSLKHHLHHPLMKRIVELKERGYADKDTYDYAPIDFEDAMDSYEKVLEIVGEICGEIIAPNAEGVDHEGPTVANGRVTYASGTQQNLDAVRKAGLMGIAMPRRYNGLNFPIVPYIMAADLVSVPTPVSRTFGVYKIVPRPYTSSERGSTPTLHPSCLRRRDHVYGLDGAGRRFRPSIRYVESFLQRG